MIGAPALNANDRPSGTIVGSALSVAWLADFVNLLAEQFPWAQAIKTAAVTIPTTGLITLPADFILDVRNGLYLQNSANPTTQNQRLTRTSYQKMLDRLVSIPTVGAPSRYTVVGAIMQVWKTPDITYNGQLAYYSRPAVASGSTVFTFPDDITLIEYVRIRGLEWVRDPKADPGQALKYAASRIAAFRKAGLGHEPEDDTIPFDRDQFIAMGDQSSAQWLGPFSNQ
jgi:hypothetical protein